MTKWGANVAIRVALVGPVTSEASTTLAQQVKESIAFEEVPDPTNLGRLRRAMEAADAVVATGWPAGAGSAPNLRLIQHTGAGTDAYPRNELPQGAYLCNVYEHEPAIAEHVFMVASALRRDLLSLDRDLRRGDWRRGEGGSIPTLADLSGSVVGVVGFGRIGRALVAPARAFGMEVIASTGHRVSGPPPEGVSFLGGPDALDTVLERSDVLVVATPLNERTRGLVGRRELELMKPSALLVNVARGLVVDEQALYDALCEGRIAGAAIDVWYRYPVAGEACMPATLPFHELDNVILTPHVAGWTERTASRRWAFIAGNLDRLARGERPLNVVREPGAQAR